MACILIVEDSIAIRQMVSFTLTRAGHVVTEISDADKVLVLMDRRKFDLVITDVNLPGTKGRDASPSLRGVPVCRIATPFDPAVLLEIQNRILRTSPRRLQSCLV